MPTIDRERQRVLTAVKPTQHGLPLQAMRACEFAKRVDAEMLLVSVVFDPIVAGGFEGAAALEPVAKSQLIEEQRLKLERVAQALRDQGAAVEVRVVWDAAAFRGILRVADEWQPTLVVVGAHEQRALQTPLKDTHWRLMHTSKWPLLLVKQSTSPDRTTILAAVDPSRTESSAIARNVLRAARLFGDAWNCQIRVAHAFPDPQQFALASAVEVSPGVFYGAENIAALHRRAVEELSADYGVHADHTDVRTGQPAVVILQLVEEHAVRLVVLGLSRHSFLQQLVLGSITQTVALDSPCDVLLIPQPPLAT